MEIDIEKYLSEESIQRIAEDVLREKFYKKFDSEEELQRILSNCAYELIYKMVDKTLNKNLEDVLAEKVEKIFNKLDSFHIFKEPDVWNRDSNKAYKHLESCVREHYDTIKEVVGKTILKDTKQALKSNVKGYVNSAMKEILKGKLK